MKSSALNDWREARSVLAADPIALARRLLDLAAQAESDSVRVRAGRAVLDRIGVPGALRTNLRDGTASPEPQLPAVEIVRERLALLQDSRLKSVNHAQRLEASA